MSWSEPLSPYPGLEPFDERYNSVFFGRDQEIVALSRKIWSPDGARVATASRDQTVRIWSVATDLRTLIDRGRSRASRALSTEERRRHGLR